jgi:3-oxoadipate enol-lactonase
MSDQPSVSTLAWRELGRPDGPAVLFSHSLGADASMWAPQSEALAPTHRVILVDHLGHGASPVPPGPYTLAELAASVLAVADRLEIDRFAFVGLSLGGLVAQWLGINASSRLTQLVAANTGARIGSVESWNERIAAVRAGGMASIRDGVLARWFAPGFAEIAPERFAAIADVFGATDPEGYVGCCAALAAADLRDELGSISTPTLVIGGSVDLATPPELAESLAGAISGAELAIIDGAAHLSNLDHAAEFTEVLVQFLEARR